MAHGFKDVWVEPGDENGITVVDNPRPKDCNPYTLVTFGGFNLWFNSLEQANKFCRNLSFRLAKARIGQSEARKRPLRATESDDLVASHTVVPPDLAQNPKGAM